MTATEWKHQAHLQEWAAAIQEYRSSGLPVKQWCYQRGIIATTYYRRERQALSAASATMELPPSVLFSELPASKQMGQPCRNVAECFVTLRAGNGSIELYQSLTPALLKTLAETLSSC